MTANKRGAVAFEDRSYKVAAGEQNRIRSYGHERTHYFEGHVVTEIGIVGVYSQTDYTRMEFVYLRKLHRRWFQAGFSSPSLVALAKRFAADVAGREPTNERP